MTDPSPSTGRPLAALRPIVPSRPSASSPPPSAPSTGTPSRLSKLAALPTARKPRILDFDIENRPLSYLGSDFTTSDITSIAWGWADEDVVHCELLDHDPESQLRMLERFLAAYDQADVVTGHHIAAHDLPIISGALFEWRLPPLKPKLTSDTKRDLRRFRGVSKSQESLADMLDIAEAKYHMSQAKWRAANRLRPEGIEETRTRVCNDIRQHKQLRVRLLEAGWLKPPRWWKP